MRVYALAVCKTLASTKKVARPHRAAKRISDGTGVRGRFIEAAGALLTPKGALLPHAIAARQHCL